ncbi:CBS domain-containing protein [Amycolatopsis cihanbeyliensis]|uniref:BON domain-containing protein n=1 Tax=Amycolatopsis cihanbeyliensis TaxID=1128664 RepID=A0A542DE07_AMYCI|nr:CBS domain-containing protein [Amycolatopsis cihanbeyliensis]TQJ01307.1 BON domain-containing protein [Amycolatopsis cihanbeyliensis]
MRASEIMTRPVVRVRPDTTIREAIVLLTGPEFAALPVVDEDDKVLGIFTESDALRGMACEEDGKVAAVMTAPVEVVTPETHVQGVAARMLRDRLRCLPVVEHGVLVGVISRRDLLRPMVRPDDVVASHVRALLADYTGHRGRWTVEAVRGTVTITGEVRDDAERGVLDALARTVPGVLRTEVRTADSAAS